MMLLPSTPPVFVCRPIFSNQLTSSKNTFLCYLQADGEEKKNSCHKKCYSDIPNSYKHLDKTILLFLRACCTNRPPPLQLGRGGKLVRKALCRSERIARNIIVRFDFRTLVRVIIISYSDNCVFFFLFFHTRF